MRRVRCDLHMHSCLSPCGHEDMTPCNMVHMALLNGMEMIALTDHNSALNCPGIMTAGEKAGLCVVPGMELCTAEEAHVVCLFETLEGALDFSAFVRTTIPAIQNRADIYGEQLIVNQWDDCIDSENLLLVTASSIVIDNVVALTAAYGGCAFPAHVDRPSYSVTASLGDIPPESGFSCAEISLRGDPSEMKRRYPILNNMFILRNSDAHDLETMVEEANILLLEELSPQCLVQTIRDGKM